MTDNTTPERVGSDGCWNPNCFYREELAWAADKLDRLEQRINRLERVVLELAARPLPGHDFHHAPWPPEGELGDIHKLHHTGESDE